MLDNSFKEYLDEEFGRIMLEEQEKYREMFKKLGFNEVNQDFVEFWTHTVMKSMEKSAIWLI